MNYWMAIMLTAVAVPCCHGAVDFSRYALILERRPFSSPAGGEEAPPPVTVTAPPEFVKDLRMVAVTESPAGVRVGFVNINQKPPKPYYLYVGDTEDGILLAEADYDAERALVRKDGQQYWMNMGAGADAGGVSEPAPAQPKASVRSRMPLVASPGIVRSPPGAASTSAPPETIAPPGTAASYAERRRQRLEEMRLRTQESRNLSEEEVEKRLREYQMKLIREGKTPLPIPITEEMDAQLVKEGILPPAE